MNEFHRGTADVGRGSYCSERVSKTGLAGSVAQRIKRTGTCNLGLLLGDVLLLATLHEHRAGTFAIRAMLQGASQNQ
jgi:hypothetical protein